MKEQGSIGGIRALVSGVFISILVLAISICSATFVFSGHHLSIYLSTGIGLALISSLIVGGGLLFKGASYVTVGSVAIVPATVIGVISQSIYTSFASLGDIAAVFDQILPTILMAILMVTFLTGLSFFMLGHFRLGKLVRYIPYPVMGGFLGAIGLILVEGSINVMRRVPINVDSQFAHLFNEPTLVHVLPGVFLALGLFVVQRQFKHYLSVPVLIVAAVSLFYFVLWRLDLSVTDAQNMGWLFEPFSNQDVWSSYNFGAFMKVNWEIMAQQTGLIISVVFLSAVALLITATGIESVLEQEVDLDRDLQVTGFSNMLLGILGGMVGYHSLFSTKINIEGRPANRLPVLVAVLVIAGVCLLGASVILLAFPKPIVGGILLYFGFSLVLQWLISAWKNLSLLEYSMLVSIIGIIYVQGFMVGIIFGLALSAGLFVLRYSQLGAIKMSVSGRSRRSNVERDIEQQQILTQYGDEIRVVCLRGYLFFGTSNSVFNLVKHHMLSKEPPRFWIFDFRHVNGIDSTAVHSFQKIKYVLQAHTKLVLTDMNEQVKEAFDQVDYFDETSSLDRPDIDHGIECCEEMLLSLYQDAQMLRHHTIHDRLFAWFKDKDVVAKFLSYLEERPITKGKPIFYQGDPSDSILILDKGQASIYIDTPNGPKRVFKAKEGAVIGEMGVYREVPRSASLVTDKDSTFYILSMDKLVQMRDQSPELAARFHKFVACLLSDRLAHSNEVLAQL